MARLTTPVPRHRRGRSTALGAPHPNPLEPSLYSFGTGFVPGVVGVVAQTERNRNTAAALAPGPAATHAAATTPPPSHSGGTSGDLTVPDYTPATPTGAPYIPSEAGHAARDFAKAEHAKLVREALANVAPLAAPSLGLTPASPTLTGLDHALAPTVADWTPPTPAPANIGFSQDHVGVEEHTLENEIHGLKRDLVNSNIGTHDILNAASRVNSGVPAAKRPVTAQSLLASLTSLPGSKLVDENGEPAPAVIHTPQGNVAVPRAAIAAHPADPLGAQTLGHTSLAQLRQAAQAGTLNVSQKGVLTTPGGRQVVANLLAAHKAAAAGSGLTGPLTPSQIRFAELTSKDLGGVIKPRTIAVQELQEQSGQHAIDREAEHNFDTLDIGYTDAGAIPLTEEDTWHNVASAAKATAEFFQGKKYEPGAHIPEILEESRGKSVAQQLQIIGESGWATSSYAHDLANTAKLVGENHDPEAVANLVAAKHAAVKAGINPTPWNGDVQGGGPNYVTIRADAKGALNWAESAVGTQQGEPRQLHWAAITHGPEDPWCAEFIGASALRQGLTLPPDPAYAGSYLNWKDGTNLGTDTAKLKPGDYLVFGQPGGEAEHIGIYKGDGVMISGNFSNEVAKSDVQEEIASTGLQGIVRPKYKGGTIKVKAGSLPGSSSSTVPGNEGSTGSSGGSLTTPGEAVPAAATGTGAGGREAALANLTALAGPTPGQNIFASGQPSEAEEALKLLAQASTRVSRA